MFFTVSLLLEPLRSRFGEVKILIVITTKIETTWPIQIKYILEREVKVLKVFFWDVRE